MGRIRGQSLPGGTRRSRLAAIIASGCVIGLISSSIAFADIPDSTTGVITACYPKWHFFHLSGMLRVSAREKATGLSKQVSIENALAQFEREEVEQARARLDRLWGQSADDADAADEDSLGAAPAEAGPLEPELVAGPREGQREMVPIE